MLELEIDGSGHKYTKINKRKKEYRNATLQLAEKKILFLFFPFHIYYTILN